MRTKPTISRLLLALFATGTACDGSGTNHPSDAPAPTLTRLPLSRLTVTRGTLTELAPGDLTLRDARMRFVATGTVNAASVRFTFDGPSAQLLPLESGEMREQFGLKLRAQDGCNLLYVMWRLVPVNELVVSTKINPGKTTYALCGAQGYTNLSPTRSQPLPIASIGSTHTLAGAITGDQLTVRADDLVVWVGRLPADALAYDGPTGARTDNVAGTLEFSATTTDQAPPTTFDGED